MSHILSCITVKTHLKHLPGDALLFVSWMSCPLNEKIEADLGGDQVKLFVCECAHAKTFVRQCVCKRVLREVD